METKSTLLLNADGTPISLLPLSILTWQDAMRAIYLEKAKCLHSYEDWYVHSPGRTWQVPSVVILTQQASIRRKLTTAAGPSAYMLYLRDDFTCQYCNQRFAPSNLTKDHVKPVSKGGKTTWENLSASCNSCNAKRGNNETIRPRIKPVRPTYSALVKNYRKCMITMAHVTWQYYIGWDEDKIRYVNPKRNNAEGEDRGAENIEGNFSILVD